MPVNRIVPVLLLGLSSAGLAAPASAQTAKAIGDAIALEAHSNAANMIASAEAVPADAYSWKPSPEQVSFGYIFAHAADANYTLCSAFSGQQKPPVPVKQDGAKQALVDQLKASFAYCDQAFTTIDPARLDQEISLYGRKVTGWWVLFHMALDWGDHYSQVAMMLRANGITPPSAQPRRPAGR
jgi:uncharacterized damage-inducible protein DinB